MAIVSASTVRVYCGDVDLTSYCRAFDVTAEPVWQNVESFGMPTMSIPTGIVEREATIELLSPKDFPPLDLGASIRILPEPDADPLFVGVIVSWQQRSIASHINEMTVRAVGTGGTLQYSLSLAAGQAVDVADTSIQPSFVRRPGRRRSRPEPIYEPPAESLPKRAVVPDV